MSVLDDADEDLLAELENDLNMSPLGHKPDSSIADKLPKNGWKSEKVDASEARNRFAALATPSKPTQATVPVAPSSVKSSGKKEEKGGGMFSRLFGLGGDKGKGSSPSKHADASNLDVENFSIREAEALLSERKPDPAPPPARAQPASNGRGGGGANEYGWKDKQPRNTDEDTLDIHEAEQLLASSPALCPPSQRAPPPNPLLSQPRNTDEEDGTFVPSFQEVVHPLASTRQRHDVRDWNQPGLASLLSHARSSFSARG